MREKNFAFRLELIKRFQTQSDAARELGIDDSCLSSIVNRRCKPTQRQLQLFVAAFGEETVERCFPEYFCSEA
jgi:hypothetical protein